MKTLDRSSSAAKTYLAWGGENTAFAPFFQGTSYLNPLTKPGESCLSASVTFEPGCRNNWHIHHAKSGGRQISFAQRAWQLVSGIRQGSREPGARNCHRHPAEVKHWHGAKSGQLVLPIAVEVPRRGDEQRVAGSRERKNLTVAWGTNE